MGSGRLEKRVVCTTEHCLRLVQRVDFISPSCLPSVEVLQQPIALPVKRGYQLRCEHRFFCALCSSLLVGLECCVHVCLRGAFLSQGLRVDRALLGRVFHQLLVVSLRILLLRLCLGKFFCKISNQEINHCDHTIIFMRFCCIGSPRRWRSGRCSLLLRVQRNLSKRCNASPSNATWRSSDQFATLVAVDPVFGGEFGLNWRLVELGIVELVETVLREGKHLLSSGVRRHKRLELR